jgi:hypothetical protein
MLTQIPYEDVQTAATQLIQCATNVLTVRLFFFYNKNKKKNIRRLMDHYNNEQQY